MPWRRVYSARATDAGVDENGVEAMGLFDRIKETISTATSGPSEETLASLTPEQRAKYDEQMAMADAARGQAALAKAESDAAHALSVAQRPLHGPAGEWVFGSTDVGGLSPEQIATMTPAEMTAWSASQTTAQFKDLLKNPFGKTKAPVTPTSPATGSVGRDAQVAVERAARDSARQPYLAEQRAPVVFARLATRGTTQIEEVTAYLASSGLAGRPDLVYGLYRVPDRISPALGGSEGARVVEWDIVHASTATLAPVPVTSTAAFFDGQERSVRRRVGEPSVLDEDLGVAALATAGIGPEQTIGIARQLIVRHYSQGEGGQSDMICHVTGIHVFGPAGEALGQIPRPIDVPATGPPGVHVEALNWGAVARAVHPRPHHASTVPSPFPYLPGTAQELIRMYIEVVGLHPNDCYATSVTEDVARTLGGQEWRAGGLIEWPTTFGDSLPCADGKDRRRVAGGWLVVLAYRDRPEYAAGRERWVAYQREVLQASLENGTGLRRPVELPALDSIPGGLRQLFKAAEKFDDVFSSDDDARRLLSKLPEHRYCSPPDQ